MKTTAHANSTIVAVALSFAGAASAQIPGSDKGTGLYGQEESPPTTLGRIENLKTRHAAAVSALRAALGCITAEPSLLGDKETFAEIDRADREMKRSKSAGDSIIASMRSRMAAIRADAAYSDDQKAELEAVAKTMAEECAAIRKEADTVIGNLTLAYKLLPRWNRIYKSYADLRGEAEAKAKVAEAVGIYLKGLTVAPDEAKTQESAPAKPDGGTE